MNRRNMLNRRHIAEALQTLKSRSGSTFTASEVCLSLRESGLSRTIGTGTVVGLLRTYSAEFGVRKAAGSLWRFK